MKYITVLFLLVLCSCPKARSQENLYPVHLLNRNSNKPIVVFLTGDGGWNAFSRQFADEIASNGYPVISLDSRKYFWKQKTPAIFASDINAILSKYPAQSTKEEFYIVGYSFGAEVAAFLPGYLPASTLMKLKSLILLSPGNSSSFKVKFINMPSSINTNKDKFKVYPEILKTKVPVWYIFGAQEHTDMKQQIKEDNNIHKIIVPGSHHYNNDIKTIADSVMKGFVN